MFFIDRHWMQVHFVVSACIAVSFLNSDLIADEFRIKLNEASLRDPVLEWNLPVPGPDSELQIVDGGLLVDQPASVHDSEKDSKEQKPTHSGSIGFRFLVPTSGDFECWIDLEILDLEAPLSGWGQGVVLKANLFDSKRTVLTCGYARSPGYEGSGMANKEQTPNVTPTFEWKSVPFKRGKLCLRRAYDTATFALRTDGNETTLATMKVPTSDVSSFEFWCTRQGFGDTHAKYLLKEVYLRGDSHQGLKSVSGRWSWTSILLLLQVIALALIAMIWFQKKRTGVKRT